MFRRIVIAHDGSEGAAKALDAALELAQRHKATLQMISVEELPQIPTTIDEVVEEKAAANRHFDPLIARVQSRAKAARVRLEVHVVAGHAVPSIVEFVERQRADLLVVGFMGHSALYNRVIGSTTDRLVALAPCAVLVVK
ncbi:universal stress protein [Elioraea tepidiphila]|uniref:universal stress protein n=1 Tax=Elioraea tepidiphila TaxID=457934 RepID=UPI00036916EB|nr:universal stress protein [Elioraea tepidiphila]